MRVEEVTSAECDVSGRRIIGVRTCCRLLGFFFMKEPTQCLIKATDVKKLIKNTLK